jgi:MSHA biogenesis protein MshP
MISHEASGRQTGFAAVAAIFLVVILAALGGFMVTFSNTQQLTSAQDLQGTRAYWAARAGLEWGVGKVSAVAVPSTLTAGTCSTGVGTPMSIDGFSVAVTCTVATYVEATSNKYLLQLQSVATTAGATAGSIGYVERSISASMER